MCLAIVVWPCFLLAICVWSLLFGQLLFGHFLFGHFLFGHFVWAFLLAGFGWPCFVWPLWFGILRGKAHLFKNQSAGAREDPGPWALAPCALQPLALGPWGIEPGPWALGPWVPWPWCLGPGRWALCPGPWDLSPEPCDAPLLSSNSRNADSFLSSNFVRPLAGVSTIPEQRRHV